MSNPTHQERISASDPTVVLAYRDGRLTEVDVRNDLFISKVIRLRDDANCSDFEFWKYLHDNGFSKEGELGTSEDMSHGVYRNGQKFLIFFTILYDCVVFVRLESHIEFMDFCRDYLLPVSKAHSLYLDEA